MDNKIIKSEVSHPGVDLYQKLLERGISQREVASILGIAHSHLNDILNGKKNINASIALSLQAIGIGNASDWLKQQMEYQLEQVKNDHNIIKKTRSIQDWNSYMNLIPLKYFKSEGILGDDIVENIETINRLYGVTSIETLEQRISEFNPVRFRKSAAFVEERKNVLAWEVLAYKRASDVKVKETFNSANKDSLVSELNSIFKKNTKTLEDTGKILSKYGIKFAVLDRPTQTPVDGKTFKVGETPAICLTLKYNRLDNFAYTLMHELGHVFLHITQDEAYKDGFYSDDKPLDLVKEEAEADKFATENLIPETAWNRFYYSHNFSDESILKFSKEVGVHPAIVRGRICYLHNEYYRRRSKINALNTRT